MYLSSNKVTAEYLFSRVSYDSHDYVFTQYQACKSCGFLKGEFLPFMLACGTLLCRFRK